MNRRVVIAGGGAGRHIFPGLAVASELKILGVEVHWLGARGGIEKDIVGKRGIELTLIDIEGLHGLGVARAVRAIGQLPRAVIDALVLFLHLRPVVILGVGGYASAAGLLAAGLLGLPWVLQEQNAAPGWVNHHLAPWADLVCCGFADAVDAFPAAAEWTGNPVRSDFFDVPEVAPVEPARILILGGSQGSLLLNRVVPRALAILKKDGIEPVVRHQAGVRWPDVVRTSYQDFHVEATVSAVISAPWKLLAEADVVVARAGALTVSELTASGRGAVLIPFAGSAGSHQEHNARALERAGCAVVIDEAEASPSRVAEVLGGVLDDFERIKDLGRAARAVALPESARRIAGRLLAVGGVA